MAHMPVAERRTRLLSAAFEVISRSGVSGATTRAIVDEAGMKLASFHYAFESREELLAQLVDVVVETQEVVLDIPADGGGGLSDLLERGLLSYFAQVRANPWRERAMFELTQYALRTPSMAGVAERQYERYRALAEASLHEAAARTGCVWRLPVSELAADLVALTDGITLAWLADGDDERASRTIAFAARAIAAEGASAPVPASASVPPSHREGRTA
ncbi:TetR/AcrR family transcriptional regulator [Herbiconiux sp. CPCC 205763]|uniref:TetR/AcrR family transcriptional regulator n=1 Tax=Herbiconiux aconitum TaxID=2970913 RepID=A0ABT2GS05_9MICO|nr:TetR/AcrR family transcriptional regulator [Herbiconiux aconitum]MCS5719007.1 TetR/AcrR family transcriptional regulator [Herbiconiux aconitum]